MNTLELWTVLLETLRSLGRHYGPKMERTAEELKLPVGPNWLLLALVFDPEPISAAFLRVRSPYTSAEVFHERLVEASQGGFLKPSEQAEGEFHLTELGRRAVKQVINAAYAKMAALQPMPPADMERLADLLRRLVNASLNAPEPPGKWCILHSRRMDPGEDAPPLVRIDQYLSDLAAYRDDTHLAAWQTHSIAGHAWEAFTFIWREEARTLDELHRKLERRGFSREQYRQALEDLVQRGWVQQEGREFSTTSLGREVRQTAEDLTNRYFYAPWSCLNQAELDELASLLNRLKDGLRLD